MEDGITPRGLIERVLESHDEDHTTRITHTRSRSQLRKTPARLSAQKHKRQSPLKSVATDTITPRTMIEDFMQGHDTVHQSMHKRPRLQPTPKAASPSSSSPAASRTSLNQSMNKSLNRSLHKKATMRSLLQHSQASGPTPRTMIQGFLAQGPEETPVASQRAQRDLEETILPSLQGRERSLLEQDSASGNSFLDAYHAASQPVAGGAPSSASRSKRTRQRAVSKADFADAVLADLEQEDTSLEYSAEEKKLMSGSRRKTKTPLKMLELATSAGLRTIVSPDTSEPTTQAGSKSNRSSRSQRKESLDRSKLSQEDSLNKSTKSQDVSLNRSSRSQRKGSLDRSKLSQEDLFNDTKSQDVSLNRSSKSQRKDLLDGSTHSQEDSLSRSSRSQNVSLNRSSRSQRKESLNSKLSQEDSLNGSTESQDDSLHRSTGNVVDKLMNKSRRSKDATLNISATNDTRSKQILMNSLRQMQETMASSHHSSPNVSQQQSRRTPKSLARLRTSPRISSGSKAVSNENPEQSTSLQVTDSSMHEQPSASQTFSSKTQTPSTRISSANSTLSSQHSEPNAPRSSSRKRRRSSGVSSRTPRSYQQATSATENVHTTSSITSSTVADHKATSISSVDVERLSSEDEEEEESKIKASDPEEEVMVGQLIDENHLEISQGQFGAVLNGEVVSIQPLNMTYTAAHAIAVEGQMVHEEKVEEHEERQVEESDEESDEEKENEQEVRSSQASKTHSLFEESSQPQSSIPLNSMTRGHYDRLQTPVLRNDKAGSSGDATPLTPFQRIMQAQQKTQQTPKATPAAAKAKAPAKGAAGRKSRKPSGSQPPRLPASLTKSIFTHFLGKTVSRDTLAEVERVADRYWRNVAGDLDAYVDHAGRATVDEGDINLLMKRQRIVTEKKSMYRLVEEYLPLQYRREIIPCAKAGNVVTPKSGLYH